MKRQKKETSKTRIPRSRLDAAKQNNRKKKKGYRNIAQQTH